MKKSDIFKKIKQLFRSVGLLICIISMMFTFVLIFGAVSCKSQHELHKYEKYYVVTETLLDSLESRLNWMDACDPGIAYDNYIKVRKEIQ